MGKRWAEEDSEHILYFNPFYEEEQVARVFYSDDIGWCFNSLLLNANEEYLGSDTLEDAKKDVEYLIKSHYDDERSYYQELLAKFKE